MEPLRVLIVLLLLLRLLLVRLVLLRRRVGLVQVVCLKHRSAHSIRSVGILCPRRRASLVQASVHLVVRAIVIGLLLPVEGWPRRHGALVGHRSERMEGIYTRAWSRRGCGPGIDMLINVDRSFGDPNGSQGGRGSGSRLVSQVGPQLNTELVVWEVRGTKG
jgi:hypothetical protein